MIDELQIVVQPKPRPEFAICHACGVKFRTKKNTANKACSRACGFVVRAEMARRTAKPKPIKPITTCRVCHAQFTIIRGQQRQYCSRTCFLKLKRRDSRARTLKIHEKSCVCGAIFVTPDGRWKWHSHECRAAAIKEQKRCARLKREATLRSVWVESVSPKKVFDRDGWRCRACGIETPEAQRGTISPSAPELDHIIPISKGGPHSYLNTQCLCRSCNALKSDKISDLVRGSA